MLIMCFDVDAVGLVISLMAFLATFSKNWAIFLSIFWSHCLKHKNAQNWERKWSRMK
jgi:hypothetical protein